MPQPWPWVKIIERSSSTFPQTCIFFVPDIYHLPPACWSTFWKSNFKQQLGCRFDIMDNESYFFVFWHMQLYMSWYIRSFFGFTFLNILYFFKYSCTNIFHRRSLYTFYLKFSSNGFDVRGKSRCGGERGRKNWKHGHPRPGPAVNIYQEPNWTQDRSLRNTCVEHWCGRLYAIQFHILRLFIR